MPLERRSERDVDQRLTGVRSRYHPGRSHDRAPDDGEGIADADQLARARIDPEREPDADGEVPRVLLEVRDQRLRGRSDRAAELGDRVDEGILLPIDPEGDEAVAGELVEPAIELVGQAADRLGEADHVPREEREAHGLADQEPGHPKVAHDDRDGDGGSAGRGEMAQALAPDLIAGVLRAVTAEHLLEVHGRGRAGVRGRAHGLGISSRAEELFPVHTVRAIPPVRARSARAA